MKKLSLTLVASAVLLAACNSETNTDSSNKQTTTPAEKSSETVVLKVAHFWPPTALAQKKVLEPWCEKIAAESNKQLSCQFYPAMQLGGTPPQLMDQVIDGVADIVFTLPGYTAGRFPSMEVMELPFLAKNAENGSRVAWEIYEQYGKKDFESVKPLAFNLHDRGQIHNNKQPITNVADLQGLKMRAPTRLTNKFLAAMGASPVSIPMPGLADALSKGVIDGYILPWEVIPTIKLHEMTKYHSEINPPEPGLYSTLFTVAMNKQKYENLPANLKAVIDNNSGAEFSALIGKAWDSSAPEAHKKAEDKGNSFNTISAEGVTTIMQAADTVRADWVKEVTEKGYDGEAILKKAEELIAKYN